MSLTTTRLDGESGRRIVDSFGRKRFSDSSVSWLHNGDACSQEERGPSISLSDGDGVSIIVADRVPVKQARPSAGSSSTRPRRLNRLRCRRLDFAAGCQRTVIRANLVARNFSGGVAGSIGGKVVHSVAPVYPAGARQFRLEARSFCKPRSWRTERWEISKSSLARLFLPNPPWTQ